MNKILLYSKLLDLLTEEQKRPYLFELLRAKPIYVERNKEPYSSVDPKGHWWPLQDGRIVDQLPRGTFTHLVGSNGVIWVYPA